MIAAVSQVQCKFTGNISSCPAFDERALNIHDYLAAERLPFAGQRIVPETYYVGRTVSLKILPIDPGYPSVIRQDKR